MPKDRREHPSTIVHEEAKRYLTPVVRAEIAKKAGYRCTYCGELGTLMDGPDGRRWNMDHIVPLLRGGTHHLSNIALSCWPCNVSKGCRTPEEWTR